MKTNPKVPAHIIEVKGEALGLNGVGIDPKVLDRTALEIGQLVGIGIQVGLVIGGGNLFGGAALSAATDRVTGDHMVMLATVMNALAMRDSLERPTFRPCDVLNSNEWRSGALRQETCDPALTGRRCRYFLGGHGNPFSRPTLQHAWGIEIEADIVLKATKVDGVYSDDLDKSERYTYAITYSRS